MDLSVHWCKNGKIGEKIIIISRDREEKITFNSSLDQRQLNPFFTVYGIICTYKMHIP
jgi:hypothetical protein